jgi:predicted Zn-ribbon and HTH transcriptional regulator
VSAAGKGRSRIRGETVPGERRETVRQMIQVFLEGDPASIREISQGVGASEKDVVGHMEHLARSLPRRGSELVVVPAECEECGFVFRKRGRLRRPGRCPLCRSAAIAEPLFSVRERK